VAANRVSAQTVTLSAKDNLILSESQLTATGDLNLLAGDTVRVRDSQAEAFSAQAGGNLLVRGNERIDILALNHPQTPFVSGGNLSLVSDGEISGDAHFASGGKFSILDLSGAPGNFVSLYDPIISSTGDITFGDYQGVALKVETTGNIQGGDITITGPDTPASIPNNDPHFTQLTTSRALILQAGKAQLDNPVNAPVTAGGTDFTAGVPTPLLGSVSVGNINTSSQDTADAGPVIIEAAGSITTGNINTSDAALGDGGAVNLTAAQGNVIAGNIDTSDRALGNSGAVTLRVTQSGNITVGNIDAGEQGPGDSGNVTLETARGTIDPGTIDNQQQGPGNQGGVVTNPPVDNNPPPNNGGGGGGGNPPPNNGGGGGGGNPPPNNGGGGGGGNPPPNNGGGGGGGNPPPINGGGGGGSSPPDPNNPPTDRRRPITIDLNNPSNTPIDDSSDNAGNDTADSLDLNRRRVADSSSERQANSEAGNRSRGLTLSALRVAAAQTPRINDAIYLLETAFTQEFENYFGRSLAPSITNLAEIRDRTQEIEQATGLKTGVIYVSFLPTAVPLENAQCQTAQGDRRVGRRRDTLAQAGEPSSLFGCAEQEQLELLMVTAEGEPIRLRVEGANRANVSAVTAEFQRAISDRRLANGTSYLEPAQQLYQWLIAPLEAELEARQIKSLVFSLDSGLRSLPLAALHDGQGFLVERYSTTLVPSLSLTTIRDRDIRPLHVLAMGASEFSDRSPLPGVKVELATITEQLWPGKSFLNETFTPANLKAQRRQRGYGIIHLATHAEFRPGSPKNSYIQFWNQKLRLNELDELGFSKPPVELLVLSACTTALGNREAELGFAGSALQAGVDSTLATLWYVSDRGSLGLTTEFYRQLRQFPVKSEALRRAQLAMIRDTVRIEGDRLYGSGDPIALPSNLSAEGTQSLSHPYYWAAFTLIGSPQ
jgi:CHAT domain-containing protein